MNLMDQAKSPQPDPYLYTIYGVGGVGKTTFTSFAEDPVYLMTEDGLTSPHLINNTTFLASNGKTILSYAEFYGWLDQLHKQEHTWKTIVIDSLDSLEKLIHVKTVAEYNTTVSRDRQIKNFADIPYGKGKELALDYWYEIIAKINQIRADRRMCVWLVGHSKTAKVEPPDAQAYTKYTLHVLDNAATFLYNQSDAFFFVNRPLTTITEEKGFGQSRNKAQLHKDAVLYTTETGAFSAKNRLDMPPQIEFKWDVFKNFVPYYMAKATQAQQANQNNLTEQSRSVA